jgi:hypothetical protein
MKGIFISLLKGLDVVAHICNPSDRVMVWGQPWTKELARPYLKEKAGHDRTYL